MKSTVAASAGNPPRGGRIVLENESFIERLIGNSTRKLMSRHFVVWSLLILSAAPAGTAFASVDTVGETVVVVRPTDMKVGGQVVARELPGNQLTVGAVQGDWIWVNRKASGWIKKQDVMTLTDALEHYTESLRKKPNDSRAYAARGALWSARGDWAIAVRDFDDALRYDPKNVVAWGNRAIAFRNQGEFDRAIQDYNQAIRLSPQNAQLYRGICYRHQKQFDKALADFDEAIRLAPEQAGGYNSRAWLCATCAEPQYRNAARALEDALKACELSSWKSAEHLGTLAAACAEAGRFEEAAKWQAQAVELSPLSEKVDANSLLAAYQAGKTYREAAPNHLAQND
jgi:Tfp pilus assembly protein PilF